MKFFQLYLVIFFLLAVSPHIFAQESNPLVSTDYAQQRIWVDSLYNNMSLEEKVGQLFMVDIFSNKSLVETDKIKDLIRDQHIGGIIFSKGGPQQQAKLNNEYQASPKLLY